MHRETLLALVLAAAGWTAAGFIGKSPGAEGAAALSAVKARVINPCEAVDWERVEYLHSFSHQHGRNPQVFYDMGFRHLPFSNYINKIRRKTAYR